MSTRITEFCCWFVNIKIKLSDSRSQIRYLQQLSWNQSGRILMRRDLGREMRPTIDVRIALHTGIVAIYLDTEKMPQNTPI